MVMDIHTLFHKELIAKEVRLKCLLKIHFLDQQLFQVKLLPWFQSLALDFCCEIHLSFIYSIFFYSFKN